MAQRFVVAVLASVGVGAVSVALADPPTTAPAQGASAPATATPAAPAATPPATPAAPAAPTAAVPATPDAAPQHDTQVTVTGHEHQAAATEPERLEKYFLSEGYKIEMHNGDKVFCRREEVLGSRLQGQKYCSTAQQLTATEAQARESVERSQRQQSSGPK
jgi:zona occludens toxin (predicted ATPase)